ncbi:hypothetical protein V8G54_019285 [Vigna mungo]|uniref:Importin N-terminal domain-containing protein n=1 Tax=Vigna mungo TaxID=3915 RepID=A0AAQ3N9U2_VIGMU
MDLEESNGEDLKVVPEVKDFQSIRLVSRLFADKRRFFDRIFGSMDLPSLAVILQAALSPNPDERKAAEESLNQLVYVVKNIGLCCLLAWASRFAAFQYTPQHLVRLLQIIVDNNVDMGVRQVASIHFKNFIVKNWSPLDETQQQISQSDKDVVRDRILVFVTQVPPLLRVQLGECLKTVIHCDYPEQWPRFLDWVKHNLQDQQVYEALFVLRILSRKYDQLWQPLKEVLTKAIAIKRPVPSEGQPVDPDIRKSWGWWRVKKWTVHILNRLYTRLKTLKTEPLPKCFRSITLGKS